MKSPWRKMNRLPRLINNPLPQRFRGFRPRVVFVIVLFAMAGATLAARAYYLQVVQHDAFTQLAQRQSQRTFTQKGRRGPIMDREGASLALSLKSDSFYAHPRQVTNPSLSAFRLSRILGMSSQLLEEKFNSKAPFIWLKRKVTPNQSEQIKALNLGGVGAAPEYRRIYPTQNYAGALLGFTGVDNTGLEGLEYAYDTMLRGSEKLRVIDRDALGRAVFSGEEQPLREGLGLRLSIHSVLQHITERELTKAVKQYEANLGIALVMHSPTGEILAMAQSPGFDPNHYGLYDKNAYLNRAITYAYEPGSTMKVLTAAIALEESVVKPDTLFFCEEGEWTYYDGVIHDTKPHGWLPLSGLIQVSSNICAAKMGLTLPKGVFFDYLSRFGFGYRAGMFTDRNGRTLAGEADGYVPPLSKWTPVDHAAISFGHGILISPLQLLTAVNAIATGGRLMQPRLVLEVLDADGQMVERNSAQVRRRVVSARTAGLVRKFMEAAVLPEGTGFRAAVPGYRVAGKTGTTELYDIEAKGYSKTKHIASFVGFAPADNPVLSILVLVVEPKTGRYGGTVAAPVFREITRRGLPLLGVWPKKGVKRISLLREAAP